MTDEFPHVPLQQSIRAALKYWVLLIIVLTAVCLKWPLLVLGVLAFRVFEMWITWQIVQRTVSHRRER